MGYDGDVPSPDQVLGETATAVYYYGYVRDGYVPDGYVLSDGQPSDTSPKPPASNRRCSILDSNMAGLSRNAREATIIRTTANAFKLTGREAAVIITRMEVVTVSSPMRSKRGPIFKKTAVVTAMARKIKTLAVGKA